MSNVREESKTSGQEELSPTNYDHNNNNKDTINEEAPLLNMTSLAHRVHDATIVRHYGMVALKEQHQVDGCEVDCTTHSNLVKNENNGSNLLSCTPWKLQYENGSSVESMLGPLSYPAFSYLDLRRQQGDSWATSNLSAGVSLAKRGNWKEAETCYRQCLDLVPDHAPTLVAYGALCANLGRTQEAILKLKQALALDPAVDNGQTYLNVIERRRNQLQSPRHNDGYSRDYGTNATLRADNSLKSAMAENEILGSRGRQNSPANENFPLFQEDDVVSSNDDEHHRRRKRKSKRAKKYRKARYDSEDSSDDKSRQRRRQRRHHHEHKKRKKRRRRESHSSDRSDEQIGNEST